MPPLQCGSLVEGELGEGDVVVGQRADFGRARRGEVFLELQDPRAEVYASATGKYLPIKGNVLADLLSDFAESTDSLFG